MNTANSSPNPMEILIRVQATPNPNAWKFVLNKPVLNEGKATYADPKEAEASLLASALFQISGVRQVHFFQNVITITHNFDADPEEIKRNVTAVIQTRMPMHNPAVTREDEKKKVREKLPPELQQIEEILDRTVRPGLQGDGGDIEVVKYEENKLYVIYQGACGTCPSSTQGTLMAIEGILRDQFNPEIEVIPLS
ncbi:MAG: NifU family protein [Bdellovibrionaceae bacterium]|nr:NifU family protein [Pseudobdellovibrionaceae bacterium]